MEKILEQELSSEGIPLGLPKKRFSLLSHLDNIEYCIEQIRVHTINGSNPVVGYFLQRSAMGTRETLHRVLPNGKAEELKKERAGNFDYVTLNELLEERKAYQEGRYKVRDRHFVGLNLSSSH